MRMMRWSRHSLRKDPITRSGLPLIPLTSIVVGKGRGTPGNDIPVDLSKIDAERERVYEHDWYDIYSPSRDELRAAYEAHVK